METANGNGEWKRRMETANGNGEWKRRMETANGNGEWKGRSVHSIFPLALSTRSFHSLLPLALSNNADLLRDAPERRLPGWGTPRRRDDNLKELGTSPMGSESRH